MEREGGGTRKGGGDCVRPCVLYTDVCARVHMYTLLLHPHTHIRTYISTRMQDSPRESLSMCRMSVRTKEGERGARNT